MEIEHTTRTAFRFTPTEVTAALVDYLGEHSDLFDDTAIPQGRTCMYLPHPNPIGGSWIVTLEIEHHDPPLERKDVNDE